MDMDGFLDLMDRIWFLIRMLTFRGCFLLMYSFLSFFFRVIGLS